MTSRVFAAALTSWMLLAGCRGDRDRAAEQEHHHQKNLPPVGPDISVTFDGKASRVVLASLPAGPSNALSLLAVFKAAWPDQDPSQLRFDLVGSDGFRPMSRPKCTRLLTGDEITHATIDATTHDTSFDDEMTSLPGCYRVRAVVAIEATR